MHGGMLTLPIERGLERKNDRETQRDGKRERERDGEREKETEAEREKDAKEREINRDRARASKVARKRGGLERITYTVTCCPQRYAEEPYCSRIRHGLPPNLQKIRSSCPAWLTAEFDTHCSRQ